MRVPLINDYGGRFAGAEVLTLTVRDGLRARGHEARLLASTAPLLAGENLAEYRCSGTVSRLQPLLEAYNPSASRAGRLYVEPAARTAHTNEPRLRTSLMLFGQGRVFGSRRSGSWSRLRRAGYVLGAPAIPLMNLPRVLREVARSTPTPQLAAALPSLLLHVSAHGAGRPRVPDRIRRRPGVSRGPRILATPRSGGAIVTGAPDLRFTIVIPTRDRPRRLAACLDAIAGLRFPVERFETIVVDDGGSTSLESMVCGVASGARVRMVRQPGSGPGTARNRGASEARGEVLVFLDDDCAPDPAWLDELDLALAAMPGAGVGGRTVNALPGNPYSSASQALIDYLYEYYNREAAKEPMFTTSNLALPREEFQRIGGFDQRFSRAGGGIASCASAGHGPAGSCATPPRDRAPRPPAWPAELPAAALHLRAGSGPLPSDRESTPIPEPASFYRELVLYPWREERRGRARMSALLALSQMANAAGYAWELRPRAGRL